jgi:superoxide dismutase, Cu-Zn family
MRSTLVLISTLVFATAGCSDDEQPEESAKSASATISPTVPGAAGGAGAPAMNTAMGTITFTSEGAQVKAVVNISNAPPGQHGFHIHAMGDCSMGGDAAGGHWDPSATAMHGAWGAAVHHGGDIGNITIAANGTGSTMLTTDAWSIGTGAANDVVGHAVILHANPDDFMTQPTGAAGARIACGVIRLR